MDEFTLIVPYYRNVQMLERQIQEWNQYPDNINIILVDDGSPEPALPIVEENTQNPKNLSVYRIDVDIPWNRGGARNLGAKEARTDWICQIDIDHILPKEHAFSIFREKIKDKHWYRFPRYRFGMADETRLKDKIPDDNVFGRIHPHMDSYLCRKELYWRVGGYDEDYSGCLGGGSSFVRQMELAARDMLLEDTFLHVYTRSEIGDASDFSLSRDKAEYTKRKAEKKKSGRTKSVNPIRFPWSRLL